AGRDHWDYAQFVVAAGGGFKKGCVVGATDKLGERVTDKFYKVESFGRTLYHLLGIDPETVVTTPASRPVKLIVEDNPIINEAIESGPATWYGPPRSAAHAQQMSGRGRPPWRPVFFNL